MTKYVLVYKGGSKGDFLCNFLNYKGIFLDNSGTNKSNTTIKKIEYCSEKEIKEIYKKNILIWPSHDISTRIDVIKNFDLNPVNLAVEKKFYRTFKIESIIKNTTLITDLKKLVQIWKFNLSKIKSDNTIDLKKIIQQGKNIKFYVDIPLCCKGITDFTDKNRFDEVLSQLKIIEQNEKAIDDYFQVEGYDKNIFKKQIFYGDIYVNKKYNALYDIKPDFDPVLYEELLEKTWLPDVANVFGYDLNVKKFGYRDY